MSEVSGSTLYGKGVFTTSAVYDGDPFLWEKHWRRLTTNADTVGIDLSDYTAELVFGLIKHKLIEKSLVNGRVRVSFLDERPSSIWSGESNDSTKLSIISRSVRDMPENFNLTVSPYHVNSRSPLAGIKSCNYLEKIMALDEAKARGFDEAIRVNERSEVTSATMANVFWLNDGRLYTPSLKTGCLAGTTREFVLENVECGEVEVSIDQLQEADSIFLTSAGLGVVQVAKFESRQLERIDHPILDLLPKSI